MAKLKVMNSQTGLKPYMAEPTAIPAKPEREINLNLKKAMGTSFSDRSIPDSFTTESIVKT